MEWINNKKDPTLLGKNASVEEIADVQRMIDNLVKDSCYEDMYTVVQEGPHIYVKQKGA